MPLRVGAVLSTRSVRDERTGRPRRVPWRPDGVSVLILPHKRCADCTAYLSTLDDDERFAAWARLRAVTQDQQQADELVERFTLDVLFDEDGDLREGLGVTPASAGLLVLDVHGQVFFSSDLDDHRFPDPDELLVEARFPALQCPECETPDIPNGTFPGASTRVPELLTGTRSMDTSSDR